MNESTYCGLIEIPLQYHANALDLLGLIMITYMIAFKFLAL